MNGRTFGDRARQVAVHRAKLRAKDWFEKRLRDEWSREQVVTELEKLPEREREIVRQELNRLVKEYQVMKR